MATMTNVVKKLFLVILIFTAVLCIGITLRDYKVLAIFHQPTRTLDSSNGTILKKFTSETTTKVIPLPSCPEKPKLREEKVNIDLSNISIEALKLKYPTPSVWGRFKPRGCNSRVRLAVIIPYRDRLEHLQVLLNNLIPFLQNQQAEFTIFLTEQTGQGIFNRGLMINAGFREAMSRDQFTCIIIHDVDLIPEVTTNLYRCHENPFHVSTANGKYGYKLPYPSYSGGNVAITPSQFRRMNGFSNWYFGWGGEDDDFEIRLKQVGMRLKRNSPKLGRNDAIKHGRDTLNPENKKKAKLFRSTRRRMRTEGLSSLHCNITALPRNIFTLLQVTIDTIFYNKTVIV